MAIDLAVKADLRGTEKVEWYLSRLNDKFSKLSQEKKEEFDQEKLTNPYSDTRILVDNQKSQIKKVLAGIDIGGAELLLADKLGDIDLVIAHHPDGSALADLHDVMQLQAQVLAGYGVPINIAESVIKPRISEVARNVFSANHNRSVDMAKILGLDFMCTHTTADNLGARFLADLLNKETDKLETVGELLNLLKTISEYKEALKTKGGIKLFTGHEDNSCGKIAVTEFTGGTSGSKDIYEKMASAGIGTIIGMHMSEEHRKQAQKYHLNVVIASHMASDSLGMNLFLDEVESKGVELVPISGLIRIKRQ